MPRNIRAGILRTPVYLGRPTITQATDGAEQIGWDEWKTFASIQPMTRQREMVSTMVKDEAEWKITIRTSDGWIPTPRWRVRDLVTGDIYGLVSVMSSPDTKSAECLAKIISDASDGR